MMSALSTTAAAPEASARDEAYLHAAVMAEHEASAKRAPLEVQVTAADLVRARCPALALAALFGPPARMHRKPLCKHARAACSRDARLDKGWLCAALGGRSAPPPARRYACEQKGKTSWAHALTTAALRAALTLPQATPPERVSKPLILALAVVASLSGACMSGQHAGAIWRLTPA